MKKVMLKTKIVSGIKIIVFTSITLYVVYILVQQQLTLKAYKNQAGYYKGKIAEEQIKTEKLERLKVLYNTDMYIEKLAREKLGLVKPGERIFIDISK